MIKIAQEKIGIYYLCKVVQYLLEIATDIFLNVY
jgi:hypothetical protein